MAKNYFFVIVIFRIESILCRIMGKKSHFVKRYNGNFDSLGGTLTGN